LDNWNLTAISYPSFLAFPFSLCSQPSINRRRTNSPVDSPMCALCAHKLREAKRILALGERERERERSFSGTCTAEHRRLTPPRRLNAALCLPERRELRLPSVNMSARIFHPRCGRRRHASFAPLSCVLHRTSILLRWPPRINFVCRLPFALSVSSELNFRTFPLLTH